LVWWRIFCIPFSFRDLPLKDKHLVVGTNDEMRAMAMAMAMTMTMTMTMTMAMAMAMIMIMIMIMILVAAVVMVVIMMVLLMYGLEKCKSYRLNINNKPTKDWQQCKPPC